MASVNSRTNSGLIKSWNGVAITTLNVYSASYDAANYGGADLMNVINTAVSSWSDRGGLTVLPLDSGSPPSAERNDIYFSSSYEGLGSGILGITVTTTDETTGSITEGDIIINSAYTYTSGQLYDVVTHEMGHFLGLGHSPLNGSTMFFQWVSGQKKLSLDDVSGIAAKYPKYSNMTGVISGKVIGGVNANGVFGAHVQAISEEYGKVMGSTITEQDGSFEIKGLLTNRTYYLYISPLNHLDSLPLYYGTVKNNFCNGNTNYTGGFFEGCSKSYQGRPQPIYLSSNYDVGDMTIHCGISVSNDYYHAKDSGMMLLNDGETSYGDSVVGYFSTSEVTTQSSDTFIVDLRNRNDLIGKELKLNIMSRSLLNPLYFQAKILDENGIVIDEEYSPLKDQREWTRGDVQLKVTLSTLSSQNLYYIKVTAINDSVFNLGGSYWSVADTRPFYFMNLYFTDGGYASIDSDTTVVGGGNSRVRIEDEYLCPQGKNVHSYSAELDLSALKSNNNSDNLPIISCATIDIDKGPGPGSGGAASAMLGFCLIAFVRFIRPFQNELI